MKSEAITGRCGYGGRIETLVIDDGFGALDEKGRRAKVEILQALRQRFNKTLVISHIDDVREAFETRPPHLQEAKVPSLLSEDGSQTTLFHIG